MSKQRANKGETVSDCCGGGVDRNTLFSWNWTVPVCMECGCVCGVVEKEPESVVVEHKGTDMHQHIGIPLGTPSTTPSGSDGDNSPPHRFLHKFVTPILENYIYLWCSIHKHLPNALFFPLHRYYIRPVIRYFRTYEDPNYIVGDARYSVARIMKGKSLFERFDILSNAIGPQNF